MFRFSHSPGRCPVDDMPHTTCTSPDYVGPADRAVIVGPCRAATSITIPAPVRTTAAVETEPTPAPAAEAPPSATFTTSTYRRAVHGRAARAKQEKPR